MLLPLGTKGRLKQFPIVTVSIIVINILFYIPRHILFGDIYWNFFMPIVKDDFAGTWLISVYMHANFWHIFGNMLFLLTFGPILEDRMGRWEYFALYHLGGAAATAAHLLFMGLFYPELETYAIGASGAVSAVMGAYVIRFYFRKISVAPILFTTVLPVKFRIPSLFFLLPLIITNLQNGFRSMYDDFSNVAFWAHIGGLAFGLGVAFSRKYLDKGREENYLESAKENYETQKDLVYAKKMALKALELNESNREAIYLMAKLESLRRPTPEAEKWYRKAIMLAHEDKNYDRAAELYIEYLPKYDGVFEAGIQRTLTRELSARKKHSYAARGLELWLEKNPSDKARPVMVMDLAHIYAKKMKANDLAARLLSDFIVSNPGTKWERTAAEKLNSLEPASGFTARLLPYAEVA